MRSTPSDIIPMWGRANRRDGGGDSIRPYGEGELNIYTSNPIRSQAVWENRLAVVHTYLQRKEKMGGDPLRSTAIAMGLSTSAVEKLLAVEIGRCPNRIRDAWSDSVWHGKDQTSREYAGFYRRQRKLDKKYGTSYAKTRP